MAKIYVKIFSNSVVANQQMNRKNLNFKKFNLHVFCKNWIIYTSHVNYWGRNSEVSVSVFLCLDRNEEAVFVDF